MELWGQKSSYGNDDLQGAYLITITLCVIWRVQENWRNYLPFEKGSHHEEKKENLQKHDNVD